MCYDLLDYYFSVAENPTWKYFANYAEKIIHARAEVERDLQERFERKKMAERWLNE
jgi:hypothetical protein